MTEPIELQNVIVNSVEVVMGCHPSRVWIISRILNRSEVIGFPTGWDNNNTAWMLTCRTLGSNTSIGNMINLGITDLTRILAQGFKVAKDITSGVLFLSGLNRTCLKAAVARLVQPFLPVLVSNGLEVGREVQVDIRNLFGMEA